MFYKDGKIDPRLTICKEMRVFMRENHNDRNAESKLDFKQITELNTVIKLIKNHGGEKYGNYANKTLAQITERLEPKVSKDIELEEVNNVVDQGWAQELETFKI